MQKQSVARVKIWVGTLQIIAGLALAFIVLLAYMAVQRPGETVSRSGERVTVRLSLSDPIERPDDLPAMPAKPRTMPDISVATHSGPVNVTPTGTQRSDDGSIEAVATTASNAQARKVDYLIKRGDSLEKIFTSMGLSSRELLAILDADEQFLVIDVLQPDAHLLFEFNEQGDLASMSTQVDTRKTVSYVRVDANSYSYKETLAPSVWETRVAKGVIEGSFYISARKAGLPDISIDTISRLLVNKINFKRDIRSGDRFSVVINEEKVNGHVVGAPRIEAFQLALNKGEYNVFLHTDGSYYNELGQGLSPALMRIPLKQQVRISSNFNPRRKHPITRRISPHNGTDFPVPVGTPVLATGDGVVARVVTHKYAGKYIELDLDGPYSSRYLHLSKFKVKKGQKVKRGQVIGLSGNTGRSTGAHLHFELHHKGRPVNAMTAKIPTLKSIPGREMAEYKAQIQSLKAMMAAERQQDLAQGG